MSKIEIALIVFACLVPLVAFIFVAPKFKNKQKPEEIKLPESEMPKLKVEPPVVPAKEEKPRVLENENFNPNEFKDYFAKRKAKFSSPDRIYSEEFPDITEPFFSYNDRKKKKETKTVAEQIQDLSPELKAMLIAGVLDKKDFD